MRRPLILALVPTALFTLGCTDLIAQLTQPAEEPVHVHPESDEQRAARILGEIAADPSKVDAILEREKLTEDQLEQLIYDIAKDAGRTKDFEAAR